MLATSIPSPSLRSNNDSSLSVPRVKTKTGARAFHSCAPSLWNNLPLSVRSASSVATFKKSLKTHIFDLASPPHRYRHSPWPVDVTELFPRCCCWTLIWLSRHWACLRRGYWRYRSLIDWLIDWLIDFFLSFFLSFFFLWNITAITGDGCVMGMCVWDWWRHSKSVRPITAVRLSAVSAENWLQQLNMKLPGSIATL